MSSTILMRRGTADEWTAANPILSAGEIGFETDTGRVKIGNGIALWIDLEYNFPELVHTHDIVIENRTSDPGAPVSGQLWLRTDL